jgi:hypothetical protein
MKSLQELMQEAFNLSLDCAYGTLAPTGNYMHVRELPVSKETNDMIFAWCDGLMHGYYERTSSGRCSLQATIDFDVAKFEANVERDIATMEGLLATYGMPRRMTFEEMQIEGYRGRWAGQFPLLTYPGYPAYSAV